LANDKLIGSLLMIAALAGFLIYTWLLFLTEPTLQFIVIKLTVYLGIVIVLAIIGYIGYTLATTPPPIPPEELEKVLRSSSEETVEEE